MSDHPDIEELPLEIDGIAVRDTIREIFRNPANGEPDGISTAGCLALAKKGYRVWNAWRAAFPYDVNLRLNHADFSRHNFGDDSIDFSRFNFGDNADFFQATFLKGQRFNEASFGRECCFVATIWGDSCGFDGASFGDKVDYRGAQFGINCSFNQVNFGKDIQFFGANFGTCATFQQAKFAGYVNFSASNWDQIEKIAEWTPTQFAEVQKSATRINAAPDSFQAIDFSGAQFLGCAASNGEGQVDFSGRKFLGKADFSFLDDTLPVNFCSVPKFHGCELHQDTSFDCAIFPDPTGNEKAARAYRTLKLAFSKQQATREEQRFFRLEMEEERIGHRLRFWSALKSFKLLIAIQEIWIWLLYKFYKLFSNYGSGLFRPFLLFLVSWLSFAQIYGGYLDTSASCISSLSSCELRHDWLNFSLQQALPLTGLGKPEEEHIRKIPLALLAVHKTLSLAALFLIGLALRNLFKLK